MTKPVSEVVEELERLEKNATPRPWSTERPKGQRVGGFQAGLIVAGTGPGMGIYADPPGGSYPSNDRQLIVAMRNALPTLLAEIKRGWEELREIAELTQRRQLPLTMQINDIARAALEGKDNG